MPPMINRDLCRPCGRCVDICLTDVFYGSFDKRQIPVVTNPDECFHCNLCVEECPTSAIVLDIPLSLRPSMREKPMS